MSSSSSFNFKSSKSAIAVLVAILVVATIMMPVQIRPAAYNQRDSSSGGTSSSSNNNDQQQQQAQKSQKGFTSFLEDTPEDQQYPFQGNTPENHLLSLYVVFHKSLNQELFSELSLPDAIPDQESGTSFDKIKSGSILDVVLGGNKGVTFFATNQDLNKDYNHSNPLFQHRVVEEWDTKGFQQVTGDRFGSSFNEFGAMASIYYSDYTYRSWEPQNGFQSVQLFADRHVRRSVLLQQGAEDAFIGILQYDMRLNDKVMRKLRNKIKKTRPDPEKFRNKDLKEKMANRGSTSARARWNQQARAVKMSKLHQSQLEQQNNENNRKPFDIAGNHRATALPNSRCCVFYSISYPMHSLLDKKDPFTEKLLTLYNRHFWTKYTYDDLEKFAILDAFVIPFSEFNRFVPFAEELMRNGIREGALTSKEARVKSLKELEQALALFLGFLGKEGLEYVMMPLRHEPANRN